MTSRSYSQADCMTPDARGVAYLLSTDPAAEHDFFVAYDKVIRRLHDGTADVLSWMQMQHHGVVRLVAQIRAPLDAPTLAVLDVELAEARLDAEAALSALGYVVTDDGEPDGYGTVWWSEDRSHHRHMREYRRVKEALAR